MDVWPSHLADWISTGDSCHINLSRRQLNGKMKNPCFHSRLRIWSRETGLAVPSRVSPHILHTWTEFGMYVCMYYYVCIHHVEKAEGHKPSMVAPEFGLARQVRPYRPAYAYSQALTTAGTFNMPT